MVKLLSLILKLKKKKECMVKNVSTFSGDSQLPNVRKVIELLTFCLGDQGPFYTICEGLKAGGEGDDRG